jgi:hypothetical protein
MPITTRTKKVFCTTDGKEHPHEHGAQRHEFCLTLQSLGFKPDSAANLSSMGVDALRALASAIMEYSDVLVVLKGRKAEDETGQWPADANVAPRPGERTKEQLDAAKARLRDDMYGGTDD